MLRSKVCHLRKRRELFKKRLHSAGKLSDNVAFQIINKNMRKPAQLFVLMHMHKATDEKENEGKTIFTRGINFVIVFIKKKVPSITYFCAKFYHLSTIKNDETYFKPN
ncbi:hypothetical protein O3G_MSEX000500 [Manduca sexta]|nr:hypothetical protein O3G_MSEX000500 [Manduca sexta]